MPLIDTTTGFGQRVQQRLASEQVIWLTTVGNTSGVPQPSPVWFLTDGDDTLLIYSQPDKPKIRNITNQPTVALTFNSDPHGNDVVIFHGDADVDADAPAAKDVPAYLEKYGGGIESLGMTPQSFSDEYSVPIRVQLTRLRGF